MIPHTIVTLYEDRAGHLWIAADDEAVGYDVTALAGQDSTFMDDVGRVFHVPGHFEADAVALLNGETEELSRETYPLHAITARVGQPDGTRLIAIYDDNTGAIEVMRGDDVRILAGANGRRYIGYLEGEE